MKQFFSSLMLLALLAGGFWMLQQRGNIPVPREVTRVAREVRENIRTETRSTTAATPPSAPQLSKYETMLCNLANEERKKRGLSQLTIVPKLAIVARGHSREMMQKNFFAHESPTSNRRSPMDRYVLTYKERPRLVAENIFKFHGPSFYRLTEADFRRAHTGWMNSPGHRANILRDSPAGGPTQIAVGIIVKDGAYWATQLFARPME